MVPTFWHPAPQFGHLGTTLADYGSGMKDTLLCTHAFAGQWQLHKSEIRGGESRHLLANLGKVAIGFKGVCRSIFNDIVQKL